MGDVDDDAEGLGSRPGVTVRVRCLVGGMERIGLWLELGSGEMLG